MSPHSRRFPPSRDTDTASIARLYQELLQPLTLLAPRPKPEVGPRDTTTCSVPTTHSERQPPSPPQSSQSARRTPRPPPASQTSAWPFPAAAPRLPPEAAGPVPLSVLPRLIEARLRLLPCPGIPAALPAMLREAVMAEVKALCWEPRMADTDPALPPAEQQELRRRLVAHTALVAEGLLRHYLALLLEGVGPADILTPPAFFIHLRGRLVMHCARLLNPQSVRIRLLEDMRQLVAARRAKDSSGVKVTHERKPKQAPERSASVPVSNRGFATARHQETVPDQKHVVSPSTNNGVLFKETPSSSSMAPFTDHDEHYDIKPGGVQETELGISPSGDLAVPKRIFAHQDEHYDTITESEQAAELGISPSGPSGDIAVPERKHEHQDENYDTITGREQATEPVINISRDVAVPKRILANQDEHYDTITGSVQATELGLSPSGDIAVPRRKLISFKQEESTNTRGTLIQEKTYVKITRQVQSGEKPIMERDSGMNAQEFPPLVFNASMDNTLLLNMDYFIKLSRPHVPGARDQRTEDLRQIESIRPLDLNKIYHLLPCPRDELDSFRSMPCLAVGAPCPDLGSKDVASEKHTSVAINLERCQSLPNLKRAGLLDELEIVIQKCFSHNSLIPLIDVRMVAGPDSPADDLRKLIQTSAIKTLPKREGYLVDADLPPLIGALNYRKINTAKLRKMQTRLMSFSEKEAAVSEDMPPSEENTCPQTDTVYLQIRNKPALKTANMQASKRYFLDVSEIRKYTPIYNDLLGDIEPSTVGSIDRGLFKGEEIREVYTELKKSFTTEHLQFDHDLSLEPYAVNVDLSKYIASSTLTKRPTNRVISTDPSNLIQPKRFAAPTGTFGDEKTMRLEQHHRLTPTHYSQLQQENYTVNSDDYLKHTSLQNSNFSHAVFHLYESDDGENEEKAAIKAAKYEQEQKREKEKSVAHLMNLKQEYSPGTWNINSIMLGGLGSSIALENVLPQIDNEEVTNLLYPTDTAAEDEAIQSRLESVWNRLHIPDGARLDMAIKYSSREYQALIPEAIASWEKATNLILGREQLLAKLEILEQTASDPNRFYQKGYEGSFPARRKEAKERKALHFHISKSEMELFKHLKKMKKMYNDTVTFKGRPYLEKMQWDKTEMLFWLQQERRKLLVEIELKKENLCTMLPPLHAQH